MIWNHRATIFLYAVLAICPYRARRAQTALSDTLCPNGIRTSSRSLGIAFLTAALFVLLIVSCESLSGETLYVDDDAADGGDGSEGWPFVKIKDAVNAAEYGDSIRVYEGEYYEGFSIQNSLNIIGNGSENTTIHGNGGSVLNIQVGGCTVSGFTVTGSGTGSHDAGIEVKSDGNFISDINCSNNRNGISIYDSIHCSITNSTIKDNKIGIRLSESPACTMANNTMVNNGIVISGDLEDWNTHSITKTNTVNGRPICYFKSASNFTIPYEAGQIILAKCKQGVVENQNCSNASTGILIGYSSDIIIRNNTCSSNNLGMYIYSSSDCTVVNNTCNNGANFYIELTHNCTFTFNSCNDDSGFYVRSSNDCLFSNNICKNGGSGLEFSSSSQCVIMNNTFEGNWCGIRFYNSDHCLVENNTVRSNSDEGIHLQRSSYNTFVNNSLSGNKVGIFVFYDSRGNIANDNTIVNNTEYGIQVHFNYDYSINAARNNWGITSGPFHPTKNSRGGGDNVSSHVIFSPWMTPNGTQAFAVETDDGSTPVTLTDLLIGLSIFLLGNIVILAYAAHISENVCFRLFHFINPLFTRLNEKKIENDIRQHTIRGRIYQCIKQAPGINFTGVMKEVSIGNGTTVYHLSVLEREGFIRSMVQGNHKMFWAKGEFPGKNSGAALSDVQREIVELLGSAGENGLTRKEIVERLDIPLSTVRFNLDKLESADMIRGKSVDGSMRYSRIVK